MRIRDVFLVVVALVFAAGLFGCLRENAPPLVEVSEVSPREVEIGDRLEIRGGGFPQGRTAKVRLEGTLRKPGETPRPNVTIDVDGVVTAPDRVEIVVREALVEQFCGHGDRALHATFRGSVDVSFIPNDPSAPSIGGSIRDVIVDVRPSSARASILEARSAEGGRVLAFLGVGTSKPLPRGLSVESVAPGSLAERSGIQVGDVLVAVDGVHILDLGDVAPASSRSMELLVRRADSGIEDTKTIPMVDYAGDRIPTEFTPALFIVGLALVALALLVLPGPDSLALAELRVASKLRPVTARALVALLFGKGRDAAISVFASALLAAFALAPHVVGSDVDSVVLLVVCALLLVASRVLSAPRFVVGLRVLVEMSACAAVLALVFGVVVAQAGTLSLLEIVRGQGALPWEFAAAKQPASALLAVAFVSALVAIVRVRTGEQTSTSRLVERIAVLFAAALAVFVFFGGFLVPGVGEARSAFHAVLGAILFLGKTWAIAALVWGAASALGSLRPEEARGVAVKRLLPILVGAAGVVVLVRRLVPSSAVESAFGATVVALVFLLLVRSAGRIRAALSRPEPHASPFL